MWWKILSVVPLEETRKKSYYFSSSFLREIKEEPPWQKQTLSCLVSGLNTLIQIIVTLPRHHILLTVRKFFSKYRILVNPKTGTAAKKTPQNTNSLKSYEWYELIALYLATTTSSSSSFSSPSPSSSMMGGRILGKLLDRFLRYSPWLLPLAALPLGWPPLPPLIAAAARAAADRRGSGEARVVEGAEFWAPTTRQGPLDVTSSLSGRHKVGHPMVGFWSNKTWVKKKKKYFWYFWVDKNPWVVKNQMPFYCCALLKNKVFLLRDNVWNSLDYNHYIPIS